MQTSNVFKCFKAVEECITSKLTKVRWKVEQFEEDFSSAGGKSPQSRRKYETRGEPHVDFFERLPSLLNWNELTDIHRTASF